MNSELRTIYYELISKVSDMEDQITRYLPKMIAQATNNSLRVSLTEHLEETKSQHGRLRQIFAGHDEIMEVKSAASFEKILSEAEAEMLLIVDSGVRDAHIVASALNVEHLEMALYETLSLWATQLDETNDKDLFEESRDEETAMADKLSGLASGGLFSKGLVAEAVH